MDGKHQGRLEREGEHKMDSGRSEVTGKQQRPHIKEGKMWMKKIYIDRICMMEEQRSSRTIAKL